MPFDFLPSLDRECVQSLGERYLNELSAINDKADRVVDKMPDNTIYLGFDHHNRAGIVLARDLMVARPSGSGCGSRA